jgi:hypothetical protein
MPSPLLPLHHHHPFHRCSVAAVPSILYAVTAIAPSIAVAVVLLSRTFAIAIAS